MSYKTDTSLNTHNLSKFMNAAKAVLIFKKKKYLRSRT